VAGAIVSHFASQLLRSIRRSAFAVPIVASGILVAVMPAFVTRSLAAWIIAVVTTRNVGFHVARATGKTRKCKRDY
jgi:hypothetical protein